VVSNLVHFEFSLCLKPNVKLPLKKVLKPANPQVSHRDAIKGEVLRSVLDTKKIQSELGWKPQVNLQQGIEKFVEWLKSS
jgi:nucleoside-diphosphate-sugar epimerase